MADIKHTDLLAVQAAITQTVLRDNDRLERNITDRIDELKGSVAQLKQKQDTQNGRVNRHEAQLAVIDARMEERSRGLFKSLSRKQKAALWTMAVAASGSLLDGLRHVVLFLFAAFTKGLAQP
jgi:chromosome segregation ATPase